MACRKNAPDGAIARGNGFQFLSARVGPLGAMPALPGIETKTGQRARGDLAERGVAPFVLKKRHAKQNKSTNLLLQNL